MIAPKPDGLQGRLLIYGSSDVKQIEVRPALLYDAASTGDIQADQASISVLGCEGDMSRSQPDLDSQQREIAANLKEAYAEGRRDAGNEWALSGEESVLARVSKLDSILQLLDSRVNSYLLDVEKEVIAIILKVTKLVMQNEASINRLFLSGAVRVALDAVRSGSSCKIIVPPVDLPEWRAWLSTLSLQGKQVEAVGDEKLTVGQCRCELAVGTLDVGVDTQLNEVDHLFREVLGRRDASCARPA